MTPLLLRRWRLATIPRIGPVLLHATAPAAAFVSLLWTGRSENLLFWIGLWFAALTHAAGHGAAAILRNELPASITLFPFFSTFRLIRPPLRKTTDMIVTASGPAANAVAGATVLAVTSEFLDGEPEWLLQWARIQIGYGLASLLPMYPLDGSRLLRVGLHWRLPAARAKETANFIGQATAAGVVLWSLSQARIGFALIGVGFYLLGRFAIYFQSVIKRINELESTPGESDEDTEAWPDNDGSTITMTQTADGVWQPVERSTSDESRTFF